MKDDTRMFLVKLHDTQREDLQEVKSKLDATVKALNEHAQQDLLVHAQTQAVSQKLDAHIDEHKSAKKWWLGVALAACAALFKALWDWIRKP